MANGTKQTLHLGLLAQFQVAMDTLAYNSVVSAHFKPHRADGGRVH